MTTKKKFQGILAQPIEPRVVGILTSDEEVTNLTEKWAAEDYAKLRELAKHYEIDDGPFWGLQLARALAREFVPGFQEKKSAGRKSKWTDWHKGALVVEIERLVIPNDPAHGIEWAANQLAKSEPWKSFIDKKDSENSGDPGEALRKIYYAGKDLPTAKVMRNAFKYDEHTNSLNEWESSLIELVKK